MDMKRVILLPLLVMLTVLCMAQKTATSAMKPVSAAEQKTMIEKVEATAATIKSLKCDFVQEKTLSLLNDKLTSKGQMSFRRPNQLCWEYLSPYTYTFILNDTKVMLKSSHSKEVLDVRSSQLFQEITRIMMNSVTGKCLSDKSSFAVTMYKSNDEWIAKLLPQKKNMKQMFTTIMLHINPKEGIVNKVVMTEKTGDSTVIQLKNITKNGKIDDKVFSIN